MKAGTILGILGLIAVFVIMGVFWATFVLAALALAGAASWWEFGAMIGAFVPVAILATVGSPAG